LPTTHHTNSTTTEPEINRFQTPENDDRFQYFREKVQPKDGGEQEKSEEERRRKKFRKFQGENLRRTVTEREALKASGFTDASVVRRFAGVRLGGLEAGRRLEGIIWSRYSVSEVGKYSGYIKQTNIDKNYSIVGQDHFPIGYVHHPLLYDQEVARLYVLWSVLYANQRFELARLLGDFLTIRLKEEYVVSRLLDAGALSLAYSEEDWRWWELLEDPDSSSSDTDSEFDGMELGYPSSDEEITECHNQDQGRAGDCIGTETPAKFPTQYSSAATAATKFSAEFAKATKAAKNVTGSSGGNHMECDGDDPRTSWLPVYSYPPGPPEGYGIRID
jgi:hypothetical protein